MRSVDRASGIPRRSAVATGTYYRARAKKFLEADGYVVADLEKMFRIVNPATPDRVLWTKRDQLGSDLLACNRSEILFVQVRGGKSARSGVAAALKKFASYPCPPSARQIVMMWLPRARQPEIVEVAKAGDLVPAMGETDEETEDREDNSPF